MNDETIIHLDTFWSEGKISNQTSKLIFFDALNYLRFQRSSKVFSDKDKKRSFLNANLHLKKSFNETFENNISEYSKTQANLSKEYHALNIPIKKNVILRNNKVVKLETHKKNFTQANIPYLTKSRTSIYSEDSKKTPVNSPRRLVKSEVNINGLFLNNIDNKLKGSTTFDSKKTNSKMNYVSCEEFHNFNIQEERNQLEDQSLSKIMKSFNDLDINDLDLIKDIHVYNNKESIVVPHERKNKKPKDYKSKSSKSGCSMYFKFNQSTISKVNCSKILVIDSNNISLNCGNNLTGEEIGNKPTGGGADNITKNYFYKYGDDVIRNTSSNLHNASSLQEEDYQTNSKKIHRSRISRLRSRDGLNKYNNNSGSNNASLRNDNLLSNDKSFTSKGKNSFQLSVLLNKMKVNFETIQSPSEKADTPKIISRNLLENFDDIKDNNSDLFSSPNQFKCMLDHESCYKTPKLRKEKNANQFFTGSKSFNLPSNDSICMFNTVYDLDFVKNLLKQEEDKIINPNYLISHPLMEAQFRSILVNWLIELSEEFAFKRDTLHYAVRYIDIFFSNSKDFSNTKLQLLGIVSLSLAAKIEEIQIPRTEDYLKATDTSFDLSEFIEFEKHFLKTIKWKLIPSNLNLWLNWYLSQWDVYLESFEEIREKFKMLSNNDNDIIYFKKPDEDTYYNFREITGIIDLIVLDINYLNFSLRKIVAASLFIVIGRNLKIFEEPGNLNDMRYLLNVTKNNYFSDIFSDFLHQSFGLSINDIYLAIIYVSKFTKIEFSTELPLIAQTDEDIVKKGHYEEFLSYQTYNRQNYAFISKYLS